MYRHPLKGCCTLLCGCTLNDLTVPSKTNSDHLFTLYNVTTNFHGAIYHIVPFYNKVTVVKIIKRSVKG